jgi:RND superfamily putative drug exporter
VLAGSFLVLTVVAGSGSGGEQVRDIGLGLALGVLMDTFLVRTLLVPSTVVLLGRWNWWPSRMSRTPATAPVAVPAGAEPAGAEPGGAGLATADGDVPAPDPARPAG